MARFRNPPEVVAELSKPDQYCPSNGPQSPTEPGHAMTRSLGPSRAFNDEGVPTCTPPTRKAAPAVATES